MNASANSPAGGVDLIVEKVKTLPQKPGVYRMLCAQGNALYVGKARNLKRRVSSYTKLTGHSNRIARMIMRTRDMEFITTATETEALLLEANLIKKLKPRYNVLLRDDKSFPYILLTGDHDYGQVLKHRGPRRRKGDYFGPFASGGSVNRTLDTLQKAFLLRSCSDSVFENRNRPCLLFQIKRCSAPCTGEIPQDRYAALAGEARAFLQGRSRNIQDRLVEKMEKASAELDFEQAAVYRDRIRALTQIQSHQGINLQTVEEADIFAIAAEGGQTCIQVFFFRAGQNRGNRACFPAHGKDMTSTEVLDAFLAQFYDGRPAPGRILLEKDIPGRPLLAAALTLRAGHKVHITVPQRGEKRQLTEQALINAQDALARHLAESSTQKRLLEAFAQTFKLNDPPKRIEVYDNSHIQGTHAVGGMIVAGAGGFVKKQYRKFNIKNRETKPGDDYAMMREVLTRRLSRLLKETGPASPKPGKKNDTAGQDFPDWPDVLLIDGGAGQMAVAQEVLAELGIHDMHIIAVAKGPERNAGRERFFMPGRPPFSLEPRDPVLYYLQRLRDEAHRFAIGSHRARRSKAIRTNPLDDVPGIGPGRKRALLHHFGSAAAITRAGTSDLATVKGISKKIARTIYGHFHETPD